MINQTSEKKNTLSSQLRYLYKNLIILIADAAAEEIRNRCFKYIS